jgi:predicted XRE-type DNA-binding protein
MITKWPSDEKIKEVLEIAENADAARPLSKNADAVDKLKHRLCREILIYKHTNNLSHEEIAKILGIGKTEVSKIVNYHIDRYTIDKLYRLAIKLIPDFHLDIAA